jgi:hypothetical protein
VKEDKTQCHGCHHRCSSILIFGFDDVLANQIEADSDGLADIHSFVLSCDDASILQKEKQRSHPQHTITHDLYYIFLMFVDERTTNISSSCLTLYESKSSQSSGTISLFGRRWTGLDVDWLQSDVADA